MSVLETVTSNDEGKFELCYDCCTSRFSSPDTLNNKQIAAQIARLNDCVGDVRGWLNLKRRNGVFSHGFLVDLCFSSLNRATDIHLIFDEIGKLEGGDPRPSLTKKAQRMRPPLRGLWHKHYLQTKFLVRNLLNETEQMVKDGRWEKLFAPHYGKYMEEISGQIAHEVVVGAFESRMARRQATGEFIVFEKLDSGSNYYLTLGIHGEWDDIRVRVDDYKRFDVDGGW